MSWFITTHLEELTLQQLIEVKKIVDKLIEEKRSERG